MAKKTATAETAKTQQNETATAETQQNETANKKEQKKVKFLLLYIGTYGYFTPGQVATVPANFAESAISSGVACGID